MESIAKYLWWVGALVCVLALSWDGSLGRVIALGMPQSVMHDLGTEAAAPAWKAERLAPERRVAVVPAAALNPIYPATPGKELLGKPVPHARVIGERRAANAERRVAMKTKAPAENPVRQAIRQNKLPPQVYAARAEQRPEAEVTPALSFAAESARQPQRHSAVNLVHGLY